MTLHYTTNHYTTLQLHYTTLQLQPQQQQLQQQLHYTALIALHYTTLHYATHYLTPHYTITLHYPTPHCITLHYTLRSLHHHRCNCNYTTLITLHHNYSSTTLQLLQLHYTTLHPAVVGEVTDQVATIAATPKNTTPTTFRSISGFALPSVIHNNQSLL